MQEESIRDRVEHILIHWECGSKPLPDLLCVTHDGDSALVVGIGHDVQPRDNLKLGNRIDVQRMHEFFRKDVTVAFSGAAKLLSLIHI